ncbi:type II toxin-antitoxin system VapB family antitoxin [Sphingomonas sp. M1-B02]|uniref:type II toxin-antitoxin system VapB family antitoxin n=1 Tax=Sphingomonas sp. M1-B02 TaxID=3114300 RepID=UPI002240005E|nr:type II toxin-antitoxin system VapB family antitoxin [Sphingomonas sp. S6-11]UZK67400.1 type II toxin-antitoxin system VapB family antitoxin [Sphingomonas sp. S6-11]
MGAQLNIKDAETVRLAHALAEATRQPVTKAIRRALERELRATEAERAERMEQLREIVRDARSLWKPEYLNADLDDLIYDERGLPR